jgi:hypothetical protein
MEKGLRNWEGAKVGSKSGSGARILAVKAMFGFGARRKIRHGFMQFMGGRHLNR